MTTRGINRGTGTGSAATGERVTAPDEPITGTAEETRHGHDDSPQSLREQIERTRHELGETVAALAAKTDVKAQAKGMAHNVVSSAAARAQHLLHPAEDRRGRLAKGRARRITARGAQVAEHERAARRGGVIAAVGTGIALLGLLLYRRQAGATGHGPLHTTGTMTRRGAGLAGGLARGARGRLGTGARHMLGGTRHIAPGLEVHTGRGMPSLTRRMTGRRGTFGRTRRIAPGLDVYTGRGMPSLTRRMAGPRGMLGGTRRIAPGLHVRSGRGAPGLIRRMAGRRGMLSGSRRIAPGLHVRSRHGLFTPGLGRRLRRRQGLLGRAGRIVPGRNTGAGQGILPQGVMGRMGRRRGMLGGSRRIAPGPRVRSGHAIFTPRRARRITPGGLVRGGFQAAGGSRGWW